MSIHVNGVDKNIYLIFYVLTYWDTNVKDVKDVKDVKGVKKNIFYKVHTPI